MSAKSHHGNAAGLSLVFSVHAGSSGWGLVPTAQRLMSEWLIDKGQWTPLKLEIELPTGTDMAMGSTLLFQGEEFI